MAFTGASEWGLQEGGATVDFVVQDGSRVKEVGPTARPNQNLPCCLTQLKQQDFKPREAEKY